MKKILPFLLFLAAPLAVLAGDDVSVGALPSAVTKAVSKAFPGAKIIAAKVDEKDDRLLYELKATHGDELLHIDVWSNGSIRKFESKND